MAQSSASFALFTLRPSPPFPLILQSTPVTSSAFAVTSHLSRCHPPANHTEQVWPPSNTKPPQLPGDSIYVHPSTQGTACQGTHQSHNSPGGSGDWGQGVWTMLLPTQVRGDKNGAAPSPPLSHRTPISASAPPHPWVLRVRGHQWGHCHPREDDTAAPSSSFSPPVHHKGASTTS